MTGEVKKIADLILTASNAMKLSGNRVYITADPKINKILNYYILAFNTDQHKSLNKYGERAHSYWHDMSFRAELKTTEAANDLLIYIQQSLRALHTIGEEYPSHSFTNHSLTSLQNQEEQKTDKARGLTLLLEAANNDKASYAKNKGSEKTFFTSPFLGQMDTPSLTNSIDTDAENRIVRKISQ